MIGKILFKKLPSPALVQLQSGATLCSITSKSPNPSLSSIKKSVRSQPQDLAPATMLILAPVSTPFHHFEPEFKPNLLLHPQIPTPASSPCQPQLYLINCLSHSTLCNPSSSPSSYFQLKVKPQLQPNFNLKPSAPVKCQSQPYPSSILIPKQSNSHNPSFNLSPRSTVTSFQFQLKLSPSSMVSYSVASPRVPIVDDIAALLPSLYLIIKYKYRKNVLYLNTSTSA